MNKARRAELAKAVDLLSQAQSIIESVHEAESEAYESMSEGLQQGDKGQAMSEAVDTLETAGSDTQDMLDELSAFLEKLPEIIGDVEVAAE